MMRSTILPAAALVVILTHGAAFAQDSLQAAKNMYAAASYEDALTVLGRLRAVEPKPEVEELRVFCLIVLGRTAEAEKAIQSVVTTNPLFVPNPDEIPPRILEVFTRTRRQLLPDIARAMYSEAKAALERKDREASVNGFEGLVRLIDSTDADTRGTSLNELRLLATGFLDLSRALRAHDVERAPPSTVTPVPPPAPSAASPVAAAVAGEVVPAVAIKQTMPAWVPADGVSRQARFVGEVRIQITAAGQVAGAQMVRSVHPTYDRLLLTAAKSWQYQPATRNGVPTASEQVIQVQLKPRE